MRAPVLSIPLTFPIGGDRPIATLNLRKPSRADVVAIRRMNMRDPEQVLGMVARLCGIPRSAADEIDMADLSVLRDRLSAFLGEAR
ncbi:phage tail assembly protein [Bosea sp. MMO-172]|uniref:phage tail assembly protein n=1 Tax=Bosea sp. MMO-172 TaxID=3127885 RepID=UPI0030163D50